MASLDANDFEACIKLNLSVSMIQSAFTSRVIARVY
jgi:hypothetical protein